MNDYAGNPLVYPALIPLIDDSDPPDASNFDPTGEALADRTAFLNALCAKFINGVDGGTYVPTAPIIIGGQGLVCPTGATWSIDGGLYFDGTGPFHPQLTLDGAGASLLCQGGGLVDIQSGSSIIVRSGGQLVALGGSSVSFAGATLSGTSQVQSGAILEIDAGGHLQVDAGGLINLAQGNGLRIADGTDPLFNSTRARTIVQPFVFREQIPNTYFDGSVAIGAGDQVDKVTDKFTGGAGWVPLTKLVNGATLANVTVRVEYASTGGPGNASLTIYKTRYDTGVRTQLATRTIARAAGTSLVATLNVPPTETIDDSLYAYAVEYGPEFGAGAAAITWYPPAAQCTNIQFFRSI